MINSITELINQYNYKVLPYFYGFFRLKKAHKIQIEDSATIEISRNVFEILKEALGNPVYVHSYYGFIFIKDGKFIAYNAIEETYGCTFLDIFIFDQIPFGKKIAFETYSQISDDIKSIANEHEFYCEIITTYTKDMFSFGILSDKQIQVLAFIYKNEIVYYLSKLENSDNITRAIPKGHGKEKAQRNDKASLRQGLNNIFDKAKSIE